MPGSLQMKGQGCHCRYHCDSGAHLALLQGTLEPQRSSQGAWTSTTGTRPSRPHSLTLPPEYSDQTFQVSSAVRWQALSFGERCAMVTNSAKFAVSNIGEALASIDEVHWPGCAPHIAGPGMACTDPYPYNSSWCIILELECASWVISRDILYFPRFHVPLSSTRRQALERCQRQMESLEARGKTHLESYSKVAPTFRRISNWNAQMEHTYLALILRMRWMEC